MMDAPDPERYGEIIDDLKEARDRQAAALAAAYDETADDVISDLPGDADDPVVEVRASDIFRLMADTEILLTQASEPIEQLHRLDTLVRISESNLDVLQQYARDIVDDIDDRDSGPSPAGMFQ